MKQIIYLLTIFTSLTSINSLLRSNNDESKEKQKNFGSVGFFVPHSFAFTLARFKKADEEKEIARQAQVSDIEKKVRKDAATDSFMYLLDANKEKLILFDIACIEGNIDIVQSMLTNNDIRTEDAGMVFNNRFRSNLGINPACAHAIATKDPYAAWKAYQAAINQVESCQGNPFSKNQMGHLKIGFVRTSLEHGLVIPQMRYEKSIDSIGFRYQYLPTLHCLVATAEEDTSLLQLFLEKGGNPHYKADCSILMENKAEKEAPVDLFDLIEKKHVGDRKAFLLDTCKKFTRMPIDTENQFHPDSPFYLKEKIQ